MLVKLEDYRFLAVVGASGAGKSSLVRAGLIAVLERGLLDAVDNWRFVVTQPGGAPITNLARALASANDCDEVALPEFAARIEAILRRGPHGLSSALANLFSTEPKAVLNSEADPGPASTLILIDQFEELFRYRREVKEAAERNEAAAFVNLLLHTIRKGGEERSAYVVITMRSDFLGDCDAFSGLPEALNDSQFLTPRLSNDQVREVVTGPLRAFQAEWEPEFLDRVVNDMGDDPDQLPLLQHCLMRCWWEARERAGERAQPVLLLSDYEKVGGLEQALSIHADQAFAELGKDPERERVARRLFQSLLDPSQEQRFIRRPVKVSEVAAICNSTEDLVTDVARVFSREPRHFIFERPAEGIIDISHESLMRQWDTLRKWLDEERADVRELRRLVEQAELRARRMGSPLSGGDLPRIRAWWKRANKAWALRHLEEPSDWDRVRRFVREGRLRAFVRKSILGGIILGAIAVVGFHGAKEKQELEVKLDQEKGRSRDAAELAMEIQQDRAKEALVLARVKEEVENLFASNESKVSKLRDEKSALESKLQDRDNEILALTVEKNELRSRLSEGARQRESLPIYGEMDRKALRESHKQRLHAASQEEDFEVGMKLWKEALLQARSQFSAVRADFRRDAVSSESSLRLEDIMYWSRATADALKGFGALTRSYLPPGRSNMLLEGRIEAEMLVADLEQLPKALLGSKPASLVLARARMEQADAEYALANESEYSQLMDKVAVQWAAHSDGWTGDAFKADMLFGLALAGLRRGEVSLALAPSETAVSAEQAVELGFLRQEALWLKWERTSTNRVFSEMAQNLSLLREMLEAIPSAGSDIVPVNVYRARLHLEEAKRSVRENRSSFANARPDLERARAIVEDFPDDRLEARLARIEVMWWHGMAGRELRDPRGYIVALIDEACLRDLRQAYSELQHLQDRRRLPLDRADWEKSLAAHLKRTSQILQANFLRVPWMKGVFMGATEIRVSDLLRYREDAGVTVLADKAHRWEQSPGGWNQSSTAESNWLEFAKAHERASDYPAVGVSFDDAKRFCEWLTSRENEERKGALRGIFRLPKDSEWELVAIANPPLDYSLGASETRNEATYYHSMVFEWEGDTGPPPGRRWGNFGGIEFGPLLEPVSPPWNIQKMVPPYRDEFRQLAPVASFDPNRFGLYDLSGNASEWVQGDKSGRAMLRGGSWVDSDLRRLRLDAPQVMEFTQSGEPVQVWRATHLGYEHVGFRVVWDESGDPSQLEKLQTLKSE